MSTLPVRVYIFLWVRKVFGLASISHAFGASRLGPRICCWRLVLNIWKPCRCSCHSLRWLPLLLRRRSRKGVGQQKLILLSCRGVMLQCPSCRSNQKKSQKTEKIRHEICSTVPLTLAYQDVHIAWPLLAYDCVCALATLKMQLRRCNHPPSAQPPFTFLCGSDLQGEFNFVSFLIWLPRLDFWATLAEIVTRTASRCTSGLRHCRISAPNSPSPSPHFHSPVSGLRSTVFALVVFRFF